MSISSAALFDANQPLLLEGLPASKAAHVVSALVADALGEPFTISLTVRTAEGLSAAEVLGLPLTLSVNITSRSARHFNGLVSELSFQGGDKKQRLYRLTLHPWLWFLSRAANCRIFQKKTIPDILKEVFDAHGFDDVEESLSGKYQPRDYVVQYRESDLNFVSRLMQEEGIYYYFKHTSSKHVLVLCDSIASHEAAPDLTELPFYPPDRQRAEQVDHVDRLEVTSRVEAGVLSTGDFNFEQALAVAALRVRRALPSHAQAQGGYEIFDYPGEYVEATEGDERLRVRLEEQESQLERVIGHSNCRGIAAGCLLTIQKHPLDELNINYLILSMTLHADNHDLESGGSSGNSGAAVSCDFSAMDGRRQFRSPRTAPKPVVQGAQTAIVVGPENEEIWTDEYGRVKVKFHWDRAPGANESSSCWIRVSQLWAGAGFGGLHVPRIGQEVIVDFLEGDPDRPIITGRVYNSFNTAPYLATSTTQSGIRSQSTKGGGANNYNEIRFDDALGKEELFIQAERDKNVEVKRNRAANVGQDDALTVTGNRRVEVKGNLDVLVGSTGGVYKLDATESVTVTAPKFILLQCGDSSIRIEPEQIVITSGTKSKIVVDGNIVATSSGGSELSMDAGARLTASGKGSLQLDENVRAQSALSAKLALDANVAIEGASVSSRSQSLFEVRAGQVKLNQ
jgi:type VI secretion system secreted protein VgrG